MVIALVVVSYLLFGWGAWEAYIAFVKAGV